VKTVAVILAAREERGLGHPVAMVEHEGGKSFLQSLASSFGKAGATVLGVLGDSAGEVREQHPGLFLVEADGWRERPGSPLRAGLRAALEEGADVVLVHPVDAPAVRATTLKNLLARLEGTEAVRPLFEGAPGFPVVLSARAAERLVNSDEGSNPEALLASLSPKGVAVKDPGVVVRIREADLYERLFGNPPRPAPPPKRRVRKGSSGNNLATLEGSSLEEGGSPLQAGEAASAALGDS
jgi:molybdenum cofactor cytidylyltransferase